jgi:hypothetical protein
MISAVYDIGENSTFRYDQVKTFDTARLYEKIVSLPDTACIDIARGFHEYIE